MSEEERIVGLLVPTGALSCRALGLGTTGRRALARLVSQGVLHQVGDVIYLPDAAPAVVAARRLKGLLTCTSALACYGLPDLLPVRTHVAVPANRGRAVLPGVVVHREARLAVEGLFVPPDRLVARLLRCAPEKESVAITDAALYKGLVTREEVAALLTARGHGAEGRRRLARCTDRARSPLESIARLELQDAGHLVVPGVVLEGVGELDNLVDGCLDLETDGYAFHCSKPAWANDRRRDQELLARGVTPLRLTYQDVMEGRTVALVEAVLARC